MGIGQALDAGALGVCIGLSVAGLVRLPRSRLSNGLLVITGCAALWGIGELITGFAPDLVWEQIGIAILYTGSIFLPPLWWRLALTWAEERGSPLPVRSGLLWQIPLLWGAAMWVVMLSNPWHQQFLIPILSGRNVQLPLWWAIALPNYALVLGVVGVQLWAARRLRAPQVRLQAACMISASSVVLVANVLYVLWPEPPAVDATVAVLALSLVLIFAGLRLDEERLERAASLEREVRLRTMQLEARNRELRELQSRLLRVERLAAAEDFGGAVAHAVNNPLMALIGTVNLSLEGSAEPNPTLERIRQLANRIEGVVSETLRLVREGELQLEPVSAAAILAQVRDDLSGPAAAGNVAIELKADPRLPPIFADRALLVAALVSIGENAIEAMRRGGQLYIESEMLSDAEVVAFRISDTGPGIPRELRERIFEPFFTTRPSGTGLGLAIAQRAIRGHSGRIQIDDRPGGGAVISVEVPLHAA
jgi:signal transduction histidine kinase